MNNSITIIVPIYNADKYLNECLDSIYNQSVLADQVILVDDGSTDLSSRIVDNFSQRADTHVVHISNSGPGPARNVGLELATSDYVYFFDSDDILAVDFIEKVRVFISEQMSADAILFSAHSEIDSDYQGTYKDAIHRSGMAERIVAESGSVLVELERRNVLNAAVHSFVTKRSLWIDHHIRFPKYYYEDEAILYPLFTCIKEVFVTDEILYTRRIRTSSIMTSTKNENHALGALTVAQFTLDFYMSHFQALRTERRLWVRRISNYAIYYVRLCKQTGLALSIPKILDIMIQLRSVRLLFRFLYNYVR